MLLSFYYIPGYERAPKISFPDNPIFTKDSSICK